MGREISHVMGHLGAGWLERPERERQERTDLLIAGLSLSEDFVVADIGAGTGYFTFPVAQRVPRGKVFSVDIQPEMLARIARRKALENVANVETVLGEEDDPKLPDNEIDSGFHRGCVPRVLVSQRDGRASERVLEARRTACARGVPSRRPTRSHQAPAQDE